MGKTGVLLATITTTVLLSGCHVFEVACPAIAQASAVSVTVAASYAPAVKALHFKACQDGLCREAYLELVPGLISVDQGCAPAVPPPYVPGKGVPEPGVPGTAVPEPGVPGPGYPGNDGRGPDMPCSAAASPDGSKRGMLMLDVLTESPMDVTASGTSIDGTTLPVRTLRFMPSADYPFGEPCGRFISAAVVLDEAGLRQDR